MIGNDKRASKKHEKARKKKAQISTIEAKRGSTKEHKRAIGEQARTHRERIYESVDDAGTKRRGMIQ